LVEEIGLKIAVSRFFNDLVNFLYFVGEPGFVSEHETIIDPEIMQLPSKLIAVCCDPHLCFEKALDGFSANRFGSQLDVELVA
jgi:hypothetical protein